MKKYSYIILDIECGYFAKESPSPWFKDRFLSSVGIQTPDKQTKIWFFNPLVGDDQQHIKEIQEYLDDTDYVVGHNFKFDMAWLLEIGLKVPSKIWCTMVVEYLIQGQRLLLNKQSLNSVAASYGIEQKLDVMKEYWDAGVQTDKIPITVHTKYLTQDLNVTHKVFKKQRKVVADTEIERLCELTLEVTKILARAELHGAPFNIEIANKYLSLADSESAAYEESLKAIAGVDFNVGSSAQLSAVMFGGEWNERVREDYEVTLKSGIVKQKSHWVVKTRQFPGLGFFCSPKLASKITGKPSTSKNSTDALVPRDETQKEFLEIIQKFRGVQKMVSTLSGKGGDKGWMSVLGKDGRLHGTFNQTIAITGRLTSSNPNMQNIPRSGTSPLKKVFKPSSSDFVIVDADLAQIEWRVAAELSRDPVMLDELSNGTDIHSLNAVQIFGANIEDKNCGVKEREAAFKILRQASKTVSFRLLYGGSAAGFYNDSRMPRFSKQRWEEIVDAFYKKYEGLARWQRMVNIEAAKNKYVRLPSGRIIPNPVGVSERERERQLCNYPVQSFSADVINLATVQVMKQFEVNPDIKLLLMVHDSMVFECKKKDVQFVVKTVEDVFNNLTKSLCDYFNADIVVPLSGECKVGLDYGSTVEVTSENVNEILQNL